MTGGAGKRLRIAALACLASLADAHPEGPYPVAVKPSPYFPVASAWRGATLFGTGRPVTVHFIRSISDWGHAVDYIDTRTGAARTLLSYRSTGRERACPDSGGLSADLGVRYSGEELVFALRTLWSQYAGKYCTGEACGPRYTGMNNAASRFRSEGQYAHLQGVIWAEMARLPAAAADSLPPPCLGAASGPKGEGVLVSFNDGMNETFGDLVIFVTGALMDVERVPPASVADPAPARVPAACRIEAESGGLARGESFAPLALSLPVSAIRPRRADRDPPFFIDQEWRTRYPGRPDETAFPNGPEIRVTAPGPFRFDLSFFTNHGGFVNRARGEVSEEMLRLANRLPDGRRQVSLMWYPAGARGERVSTGAYIVKGSIESLGSGDAADCGPLDARVLSRFGYIRN